MADTRRGQIFTKLAREIIVVVRQGGPNPEANFKLRLAIQRAKDSSMPLENIERAIKRGSGTAEGTNLEEVTYEGYGPGGTAILLQVLTDNRNRTTSEVRNAFARGGGNLSEAGSVSWLFEPKGVITVEANGVNAEELGLYAIDAGADDVKIEGDAVEVYTRPHDLEAVRKALEEKKVTIAGAEISMIPKSLVELDEKSALQALKLLDRLEEMDEVQRVFTNADFPTHVLESYHQGS